MSSLLDRVSSDAKALQRKAGVEDGDTLDEYFTALRETELKLEKMGPLDQGLEPPIRPLGTPARPSNLDEQVNAMLDVIAMALWTDSTRCISYMLGNSNSRMIFDFLGIKKQHHYLSHFFRNFSRENIDSLLKISLWHMEKFDYLLNKLKSYKDHHGRLLDHCVVLYGSGMGHSDNHTAQRIPIVLAGQGGGKLKTGRYLRYSKNQELGRLHLSLLDLFGVKQESFANAKQPLPGLDGGKFDEYSERPFDSWVKVDSGIMTVQGRLRMSDNLDEAKVFTPTPKAGIPSAWKLVSGTFTLETLLTTSGPPSSLQGKPSRKPADNSQQDYPPGITLWEQHAGKAGVRSFPALKSSNPSPSSILFFRKVERSFFSRA